MNRSDLQSLSRQRRREAAALLRARHFPGAYYLVGYAVECALKACIARHTRRFDFPSKQIAQKVFVHELEVLVKLAGLMQDLERDLRANASLQLNWAIVKDWSEESRYLLGITRAQALDLYSACTSRRTGVLPWVRQRW
jgi:hypothetical protein